MRAVPQWCTVCSPTWPAWARNWLSTRGSLTKRLVGLNKGFHVQRLSQGEKRLHGKAALPLGLAAGTLVRERNVRLHVSDTPAVVARTLVKMDGALSDWPFWRGLGTRSLGSVLFSDHSVKRGPLRFAKLPADTPWVLALVQGMPIANHLPACWYARCAQFSTKTGRTPMWVIEVFLPSLEEVSSSCKLNRGGW